MKVFSKILACIIISFLIINTCLTLPSYAALINKSDWNQFVNGMFSSQLMPNSMQNTTFARVLLTCVRIAEVFFSGLCVLLVTVMAIRYFTVSTGAGKAEGRGAIRNSLILSVIVFSFEGILELVIQMFI